MGQGPPYELWRNARWLLGCAAVLVALGAGLAAAVPATAETPRPPELVFEAPPQLARQVELLASFDRASLLPIMELVGLDDPGPPIRVLVAAEGSPEARRAPSWSDAYAIGSAGLVVLLPSRVPAYPDRSLDAVLRHEVAHVLIARAARRSAVPRWFNEGLAVHAARKWGLDDPTRLVFATLGRRGASLDDLDRGFHAGARRAANAYALSAAFVRYLLDRHGDVAAARILAGLGDGLSFSAAFHSATGTRLAVAEAQFWRHLNLWNKWVPFLGSSTALWMGVTALALLAFRRRRQRDAEIRARWDEEDRLRQELTGGWVN